jgi:hypothetical protein
MELNQYAQVRVEQLGGLVPVLFIDDFYVDPDAVRAEALAGRFDQAGALYPGRHAKLGGDGGQAVCAHLCRILALLGAQGFAPEDAWTDFSILTVKAKDLLMVQKHPHVDPVAMAGVLYLTPGNSQGTCLFRNRVHGRHALVTEEDYQAHQKFIADYGISHEPANYEVEDSPVWERIGRIEAKYNRLVCYPGNVFHSIDLTDVGEVLDMDHVRLTQRFFFANPGMKGAENAGTH